MSSSLDDLSQLLDSLYTSGKPPESLERKQRPSHHHLPKSIPAAEYIMSSWFHRSNDNMLDVDSAHGVKEKLKPQRMLLAALTLPQCFQELQGNGPNHSDQHLCPVAGTVYPVWHLALMGLCVLLLAVNTQIWFHNKMTFNSPIS